MGDVSYSKALVDAATQYAINHDNCSEEQLDTLRRFAYGDKPRDYVVSEREKLLRAAAEILAMLHCGAEVHE